ncbi:DNA photolyase [Dorcoceras hygrometricum]|uniref:DNA photolyase n=1 Tax=Dorcoceras hygrometricum TaxID=472368 RepID=A0A2Z7BN05_9LAMI|nr:DNA photolyase [Dorcoceras hygrometricum]
MWRGHDATPFCGSRCVGESLFVTTNRCQRESTFLYLSDRVSCWYISCSVLVGSSSNADVDFRFYRSVGELKLWTPLATVLHPIPFSGSVVGWKQDREAPSSAVCCFVQVLYQISRDPIVVSVTDSRYGFELVIAQNWRGFNVRLLVSQVTQLVVELARLEAFLRLKPSAVVLCLMYSIHILSYAVSLAV